MSERRVYVDKQKPSIYKALGAAAIECRAQAVEAGITRATLELINVRASQINGCAFCLDLHTRLAVKEGVTAQQLGVLPAWRETEVFEPIDRAALEIAEAVTNVATDHLEDADYDRIRGQLNDDQLAVLVYAASIINAFNRLSILSQHPVTHREARD
ncbi:carboxymuconolactone decarboxylase family protein [Smaragdicoccus niigatensis]|uniref:carboxymuconolactone decarboxylase family protein n=1 Tax=Smaragdicoccus niigatensis TaxID=359359 RepID=UPI0004774D38|nr:carboxymuconolactone decarboxylase family protein [Smaragdicoccus niigatensis]